MMTVYEIEFGSVEEALNVVNRALKSAKAELKSAKANRKKPCKKKTKKTLTPNPRKEN